MCHIDPDLFFSGSSVIVCRAVGFCSGAKTIWLIGDREYTAKFQPEGSLLAPRGKGIPYSLLLIFLPWATSSFISRILTQVASREHGEKHNFIRIFPTSNLSY